MSDRLLFGPNTPRRTVVHSKLSEAPAASPLDSITKKSLDAADEKDAVTHEASRSGSITSDESIRSPLARVTTGWQTLWQRPSATWSPTLLQLRPLVGLSALIVTIGCVLASLAILLISRGQAVVRNW